MNHITIIGRITKDPEIRYSNSNQPTAYGSYTIAVDRPQRKDADKVTDFIYCKVLGKPAEFAEKYLRKGMKIAIEGRMQVDIYEDNNGNKRSTTYVLVNSHEFCESKSGDNENKTAPTQNSNNFMDLPDGFEDELPFQ